MRIVGPVLLGFAEAFEEAYGKPSIRKYPEMVPSRVGAILLPFPCPHCMVVRSEVVHPIERENYREPKRGFSWCPSCRGRYKIDYRGTPLAVSLPPGATSAPAQRQADGTASGPAPPPAQHQADGIDVAELPGYDGFDLLGVQ